MKTLKTFLRLNYKKVVMKIYCKNVVHKILKNLSDLELRFHFCDVSISDIINLGFFDFINKNLNYTKIGLL